MKLTTYFRAMENVNLRICLLEIAEAPYSEFEKHLLRYQHLRDGLLRRMERMEQERDNLKADTLLLREWLLSQ